MSDSTDDEPPLRIVDPLYLLTAGPTRHSWEGAKKMSMSLAELANKHDIQIEMPTHDELTMTGRRVDVDRFKPEFDSLFLNRNFDRGLVQGEVTVVSNKPRDVPPKMCFYYDFATIEKRILAAQGQLWMFMPDPFEDRGEGGVE